MIKKFITSYVKDSPISQDIVNSLCPFLTSRRKDFYREIIFDASFQKFFSSKRCQEVMSSFAKDLTNFKILGSNFIDNEEDAKKQIDANYNRLVKLFSEIHQPKVDIDIKYQTPKVIDSPEKPSNKVGSIKLLPTPTLVPKIVEKNTEHPDNPIPKDQKFNSKLVPKPPENKKLTPSFRRSIVVKKVDPIVERKNSADNNISPNDKSKK
jgi:hypothetical protein